MVHERACDQNLPMAYCPSSWYLLKRLHSTTFDFENHEADHVLCSLHKALADLRVIAGSQLALRPLLDAFAFLPDKQSTPSGRNKKDLYTAPQYDTQIILTVLADQTVAPCAAEAACPDSP